MHIAIDASRTTVAQRTGTERYALSMIRALLAQEAGHTYTLYMRDTPPAGLFGIPHPANRLRVRIVGMPRLWTHVGLARALAQDRPDVIWVPAHTLPLICPTPGVVTIHDIGYRFFPQAHPARQRRYLEWSTRHSAGIARRILADSQATLRDLERAYRVPPGRIEVVYPGRDETLQRVDPAEVRARHGLTRPYLLHVGTVQPRKNLVRLIEAHARARVRRPELELVLAGAPGWLSDPILQAARTAGVRVLGAVAGSDLPGLYSGAEAFVFPSLYEGFGFPVLEAQACGTPVICSQTSSLSEVAGEGALLIDPQDTPALAAAIEDVLGRPEVRARLTEAGAANVLRFSWAEAAAQARTVLEAVAGQG
ncbi:MAG TPA: glycosyltransferase family 1 protein [Anaerolineales bacterium]|nr:glycosyltransferase family 1 protein [Anaerolineales bacterium]